ncbi:MAG TPA: AAA family ATPase [Nitrosomonas europaea]|nr:AAA family ATPase [Nitrosomonas europaea]HRQ08159.1 AAA family ATPase [Nitrosomonas europaea]
MTVDRTRRFALPGIQDLNKDQDEALALPMKGQHLIIGGPGTGKSVVALLKARRLAQSENAYRTLVYNQLLDQSNRHLFGSEKTLSAKTWDSWFRDICRFFLKTVPTLEPDSPGGYRPVDWNTVLNQVQQLENTGDHSQRFLVIDEGQDMPPAFYQTLVNLGFENFYVVADQNQQMNPDRCSSIQNIENALGIEKKDTKELIINYRNTLPIARLAQHFYPDDPASPKPELPEPGAADITPELWRYGTNDSPSLNEIIDRLLYLSDRFPKKLIGIITPNNVVREKFCDVLLRANPTLDNGKPPIQTFISGQKSSLNFGTGGIMVINAQSCKGLEFDIVILADIDQHKPKQDIYALKSRFYVMVARGREQVIMLRTGSACPVVESLLPADSAILVRK